MNKRKAEWISSSFGSDFISSAKPKNVHLIDLTDDNDDEKYMEIKPWVEKYKPMCENDLAVHKKKIEDVKHCLQGYFLGDGNKNEAGILLLSGPAGTGKTALIEVLAKQMKCKLKEWINPVGQDYQEKSSSNWRDYLSHQTSQSEGFNDFLLRANRYSGLQMVGGDDHDDSSRMIVLIEDFPNFILRDPKKLHAMLKQYLSSGRNPIVFIMSDTHTSDATVHAIFPKNIQIELKMKNISFNGVATTSLMKFMTKIVKEESKINENILVPSKEMYDLIIASCNGDIRSGINSLQFYCTKIPVAIPKEEKFNQNIGTGGNKKCDIKPKVKGKKNKGGTKEETIKCNRGNTKLSDENVSFCGRDASLFLFKALGKILYSKRAPTAAAVEAQLPPHLHHHTRCMLQVDPEEVFERTQITSDTFVLYLHQNYTQFFSSIDDLSSAATNLSDADLMMGAWINRQVMSDYSSSTAMRGIMFSNRAASSATGTISGGWRPLHKPQWFASFKTRNQNARSCKDIFRETRQPSNVLYTEYLPYISNMNINFKTSDHKLLAHKIGRFEKYKQNQGRNLQTLTDGVHDLKDESEFTDFTRYRNKEINEEELDVNEINDDDLIEDFDD